MSWISELGFQNRLFRVVKPYPFGEDCTNLKIRLRINVRCNLIYKIRYYSIIFYHEIVISSDLF
jgi:hypothetical protein